DRHLDRLGPSGHAVDLSLLHRRLRAAARSHAPRRASGLRAQPDLPGVRLFQVALPLPAAGQGPPPGSSRAFWSRCRSFTTTPPASGCCAKPRTA
ncbi:hypothetical protein CTI14_62820, partial [Methylobacterium radiotolerans]